MYASTPLTSDPRAIPLQQTLFSLSFHITPEAPMLGCVCRAMLGTTHKVWLGAFLLSYSFSF